MEMVEGKNQSKIKIARQHRKLEAIAENGGEDRISALPDCLLVEIVSRLGSTEDAIRTGTLSNRWKHVWTSIPVLIFKHLYHKKTWSTFASLVDKTLTQHHQLKLKKFVLYARYGYGNRSKVESWIRYAIRCNVEELNLELWDWRHGVGIRLGQFFCINSCFTDLRLCGCILDPSGAISWKNLRSLWISRVKLDKDLIENIFSGSPVLETVVLDDCDYFGVGRLDITSKSVKKFVLYGCREPSHLGNEWPEDTLEINAPNILSLTIKGNLALWNLFLLNLSSLIEADLDYANFRHWEEMRKEEMLKRLIPTLSHVKELKIGPLCSRVLSRLKAKGFVVPSNIKFPSKSEDENENESESESESESERERERERERESENERESERESESENESESESDESGSGSE